MKPKTAIRAAARARKTRKRLDAAFLLGFRIAAPAALVKRLRRNPFKKAARAKGGA